MKDRERLEYTLKMWANGLQLSKLASLHHGDEALYQALLMGSNHLMDEARVLASSLPFKLNREFVERALST